MKDYISPFDPGAISFTTVAPQPGDHPALDDILNAVEDFKQQTIVASNAVPPGSVLFLNPATIRLLQPTFIEPPPAFEPLNIRFRNGFGSFACRPMLFTGIHLSDISPPAFPLTPLRSPAPGAAAAAVIAAVVLVLGLIALVM